MIFFNKIWYFFIFWNWRLWKENDEYEKYGKKWWKGTKKL